MANQSASEHFARALWPSQWAKGWFGVFAAYYDASGGHDTGVMAVAGLAADVRSWMEFEPSWRLVLAKYDVPYFHMNEFHGSHGPFKSWRGAETKRANFVRELVQVVKEIADFWVACSVRNSVLEQASKRYGVDFHPGPYPLLARVCIGKSHDVMLAKHGRAEIHHIFESGDKGKGALVGMIERLNAHATKTRARGKNDPALSPYPIPLPSFKPSRDTDSEKGLLPLQASDLFAWEFHKMHREATADSMLVRRPLQELRKSIPGRYAVLDRSGVFKMCESMGLRPRTR